MRVSQHWAWHPEEMVQRGQAGQRWSNNLCFWDAFNRYLAFEQTIFSVLWALTNMSRHCSSCTSQEISHRCPFMINVLRNFSDTDPEGISGKTRPLLERDFSAGELGWLNVAAPLISYLNTCVTLQPPPLCASTHTQNGHQAGGQQPWRAHCIFSDPLLWAGKTTIIPWVRSYDSTQNNIPLFPSCWLIRGQSHASEKIEDNSCLMLSSQVVKKHYFL